MVLIYHYCGSLKGCGPDLKDPTVSADTYGYIIMCEYAWLWFVSIFQLHLFIPTTRLWIPFNLVASVSPKLAEFWYIHRMHFSYYTSKFESAYITIKWGRWTNELSVEYQTCSYMKLKRCSFVQILTYALFRTLTSHNICTLFSTNDTY